MIFWRSPGRNSISYETQHPFGFFYSITHLKSAFDFCMVTWVSKLKNVEKWQRALLVLQNRSLVLWLHHQQAVLFVVQKQTLKLDQMFRECVELWVKYLSWLLPNKCCKCKKRWIYNDRKDVYLECSLLMDRLIRMQLTQRTVEQI